MDFKLPFLHKHYLLYDKYEKQEAFCDECNQHIDGWAFTCEHCKFWLHKLCAKHKLPPNISHPLHPKGLHLFLSIKAFVCNKCFSLSQGYGYRSPDWSFYLDLICTALTNDQTLEEDIGQRSKGITNEIQHFSHRDSLTFFNYRKVSKYEYCCSWCDKPLSGMSYGCLHNYCSSPFFLHQFCLYTIPNKILEHHFHPSHPLFLDYISNHHCNGCKQYMIYDFGYSCERDDFELHLLCAKLKPTLRDECHEHCLTYVVTEGGRWKSFQCQKCNSREEKERSTLYCCVQCNCNFHVDCLIPSTVKHQHHIHSLTLMTKFREDYSGEYYCDICEKQRNPDHHVYCCKECMYIAHIECAHDKVVDAKSYLMSISSLKHQETQQLIKDFKHKHPLILKEITGKDKKHLCQACGLEVSDKAYVCEREGCGYYLHKTCGELPFELLYPPHSLDHPLILFSKTEPFPGFICDHCRHFSRHWIYHCFLCNFKLDIKCALLTASKIVNQREGTNEIQRQSTATVTKLSHFCHHHDLLLVNFITADYGSFHCDTCMLSITASAYCCRECNFYIHESCLGKLPREIQILSHPLHPFPRFSSEFVKSCLVCKRSIGHFVYVCSHCPIVLHFPCTAPLLKQPLCSKSHPHNLYLFHCDILAHFIYWNCRKCKKSLKNKSVYRCIECDCNFHLQCVEEVSFRFKSKYHIHSLTLKDGHKEDDFGENYCDICEKKRNPKDDVYYCQECDGMFVTHVNCPVTEIEEVLQQYGPAPYSPP